MCGIHSFLLSLENRDGLNQMGERETETDKLQSEEKTEREGE